MGNLTQREPNKCDHLRNLYVQDYMILCMRIVTHERVLDHSPVTNKQLDP